VYPGGNFVTNKKLLAIEPEFEREVAKAGGDRSFGVVFAAAFIVVGLWPLLGGHSPRFWALAIACSFAVVAMLAPWSLRPLNLLWGRFGALMHRIVTPLIMGAVFFLTVLPTAIIVRLRGKDPLRLKRNVDAASYWIERYPPGPDAQTMTRQF
jgi:Saxitoxin biosynthesis operon protein SxtJ